MLEENIKQQHPIVQLWNDFSMNLNRIIYKSRNQQLIYGMDH